MAPLNSEAAILNRVIEPEVDDLPPETAHYILRLEFRQQDMERMNVLAEKARKGTLSEEERAEAENYEGVGHLLALMQSKARRSLRKVGASS